MWYLSLTCSCFHEQIVWCPFESWLHYAMEAIRSESMCVSRRHRLHLLWSLPEVRSAPELAIRPIWSTPQMGLQHIRRWQWLGDAIWQAVCCLSDRCTTWTHIILAQSHRSEILSGVCIAIANTKHLRYASAHCLLAWCLVKMWFVC